MPYIYIYIYLKRIGEIPVYYSIKKYNTRGYGPWPQRKVDSEYWKWMYDSRDRIKLTDILRKGTSRWAGSLTHRSKLGMTNINYVYIIPWTHHPFTHIYESCPSGTVATSEVTLNNMGKIGWHITTTIKKQSTNSVRGVLSKVRY